MLLLSRKASEEIVLTVGSEKIVVQVCRFKHWHGTRSVVVGITASNNVKIRRAEIEEKHGNSTHPI